MSDKSREEIRSEYEKDYLERLAKKKAVELDQYEETPMSEEERTRKVEDAESPPHPGFPG